MHLTMIQARFLGMLQHRSPARLIFAATKIAPEPVDKLRLRHPAISLISLSITYDHSLNIPLIAGMALVHHEAESLLLLSFGLCLLCIQVICMSSLWGTDLAAQTTRISLDSGRK